MPPLERAKRKIAFRIAEALEHEFASSHAMVSVSGLNAWDTDEAADLIYQQIPDTNAEADEQYEAVRRAMDGDASLPTGPSLIGQIREALGFDPAADIRLVLQEILKIAKERNDRHSI